MTDLGTMSMKDSINEEMSRPVSKQEPDDQGGLIITGCPSFTSMACCSCYLGAGRRLDLKF